MRTWTLAGALLLLLLAAGPGSPVLADEKYALSKEDAIGLVAQAAAAPTHYVDMLVALGAKVTPKDLQALEGDVPLTVVAVAMMGGELDERDLKLVSSATPKAFLTAIRAGDAQAPYVSIVQKRYVQEVTVDVNGSTATGTLRVRAPDVYEGTLAYTAFHDGSGWRVLELAFAHSKVRTSLEDGHWRLHLPEPLLAPNPLRGTQIDVPRVGTLGPLPGAAGAGSSVTISVTRDGWIRVPGENKPLSLLALRRWLQGRAHDASLREADGSSKIDAVLDIDATTPWVITQWLMQTCAHVEIKIYKLWLGAQSRDGKDGAIGILLPKDGSIGIHDGPSREVHKVKLFKLQRMTQPSDLRALYAALKRQHEDTGGRERARFEIIAPPPKGGGVPHGYVVQVLDVCLAVGARDVTFEGAAMPLGDALENSAEALKGYIDALRQSPGVPIVKVGSDPNPIPPAATGLPDVPARGRLSQPYGAGVDLSGEWVTEETLEVFGEEIPVVPDAPLDDDPFEGPAMGGGIGGAAGGAFHGRGGSREKPAAAAPADATPREDRAVEDALRWLAAHQAPNGGWGAAGFGQFCDGHPVARADKIPDGRGKALYDPGVTGLALQAFLGAGYTNRGRHPYAKVVSRGLRYLKNIQDPEGCFGPRSTQQYIYNHAMCAVAMVEAYGMTGSPIFKGSAQRALDFVALARNPYFAWRYGIKPGDNDTSVTGWMLAALWGASLINEDSVRRGKPEPLSVDMSAFDGAKAWLDKVTDPGTGRVGYVTRGTGPARPQEMVDRFPGKFSESMTAVSVLSRMRMGEDAGSSEAVRKGLALLAKRPPTWNEASGEIDMYYWHWGALATFKAGGKILSAWREALLKAVVKSQRGDTDYCQYKGSWDPIGPWGPDGGRVYSTAMMALCLQVRYRY